MPILPYIFQDFDSDSPRAEDVCGLLIIKVLEKNPFLLKRIRLVILLSITLLSAIVNPRPLGGGGADPAPPPCRIFSVGHKRCQIPTRNSQYLPQHQFNIFHQKFKKIFKGILRKWCFSDIMFRHFGSKAANVSRLLECLVLK